MCTYSAVGDTWRQDFPNRWPQVPVYPTYLIPEVSREEFEALKAEVEALRALLAAAKTFDAATGQKDCQMDEKIALIRRIAEAVGVDLEDVLDTT